MLDPGSSRIRDSWIKEDWVAPTLSWPVQVCVRIAVVAVGTRRKTQSGIKKKRGSQKQNVMKHWISLRLQIPNEVRVVEV